MNFINNTVKSSRSPQVIHIPYPDFKSIKLNFITFHFRSPFSYTIDPKKAWSKEQNDKYQALISEAKELIDYFIHLEADEGQGPYRLGLMILHGGFSEKELENSEAAGYTEEDRQPSIGRIREIRLELDDLINKLNTKGD